MIPKATLMIAMLVAAAGCTPDDRCGDDFEWDPALGVCLALDTDTGEDTDADSGPDPDGGGETGIGETCTPSGDECAGFEADYCAAQPGADSGYCTFDECAGNEGICPSPYQCCNMGSLSFCANESDYEVMAGLGMCQE